MTGILAAFFLSGAGALIYQVVWVRMLSVTFGATVFAVATVVAVFMAGLALGSVLFGRRIDRVGTRAGLLRYYGLLELGIGLYCLLTPWLFAHLDPVYAWVYRLADINFYLFSLLRFLLSALVLLVPTVLMGGTLPVISRYLVRYGETLGRHVGLLYGFNTLGAVSGVLLSAFALIPALGITGTLWLAVAANLLIALGFLVAARRVPAPMQAATGAPAGNGARAPLLMAAFALAGFAALGYEVVWFRILGMTIGNTVYAFAAMVAMFLLGIALGSHIAASFIDRLGDRLRAFALLQLATGVVVIVSTPLLGELPLVFMWLTDRLGLGFVGYHGAVIVTAALAVLAPTLLMGMAFPLAIRLVARGTAGLGRSVGAVYAVNTAGGVLGSFAAGFVLIPLVGIKASLIALAALNLALACGLLLATPGHAPRVRVAVALAALATLASAALYPQWDRRLLSSGVYFYAARYAESFRSGELTETLAREREVVYYNEGVTGTVSVIDLAGDLALAINGKVTAGAPGNLLTHTMLGALPVLLHPDPREVALIGLASGVTLGAMEQFDVDAVDAIEISPEVVEAAGLFSRYNHDALADPRANVIIDDGRTRLAYGMRRYDVVVSEPPVPLSSGVANLFTVEFYRAMRRSLAEGGIACQWVHAYGMEPADLRLVLRSFRTVFPHATLWQYDMGNIMLIGTTRPLSIDYDSLVTRLAAPRVNALMSGIGVGTAGAVIGGLTLDAQALAGFAGDGPLNTDDRPLLEFALPRNIFKATEVSNYNALARHSPVVRPRVEPEYSDGGRRRYPFMALEDRLGASWRLRYAGFNIRIHPVARDARGVPPMISKGLLPVAEWEAAAGGQALRVSPRHLARDGDRAAALSGLLPDEGPGRGPYELDGKLMAWRLATGRDGPLLTVAWTCPGRELAYVGEVIPSPPDRGGAERLAGEIVRGLRCVQVRSEE